MVLYKNALIRYVGLQVHLQMLYRCIYLNTPGSIFKRRRMKFKISGFTVLIEQDEDGMYIATVPDIPGCYTQGKTVEQAIERVEEAIQVCLEAE